MNLKDNKNFTFSQNSLKVFKLCPLKFKQIYMDNMRWSTNSEVFQRGISFHLLAQRYFSGIEPGEEYIEDEELKLWFLNLKAQYPIDKDKLYKPEFELRLRLDFPLQAKYDLLVVEEDSIHIIDWKTNRAKMNRDEMKYDLQTLVYLYILGKSLAYLNKEDIKTDRIFMHYWQASYDKDIISIPYNEVLKKEYKEILSNLIEEIYNFDFDNIKEDRNRTHCKRCELKYFCKGERVDFSIIEEELIDFNWDEIEEIDFN